jgi:hypothetical protein
MAPFTSGVNGNTPDPAEVTQASGMIVYQLNTYPASTLLVQFIDSLKIKVEVFPQTTASEFTEAAQIYIR